VESCLDTPPSLSLPSFQSTGITVADDVQAKFNEMKIRKTCNWMIFTIANEKEVVVADQGTESPADFCEKLAKDYATQPCWAVVSVDFDSSDGRAMNKLVLVSWTPEYTKPRLKMMYSGTKDAVVASLQGMSAKLQATAPDELTPELLIECAGKFS
jgi:cofilin